MTPTVPRGLPNRTRLDPCWLAREPVEERAEARAYVRDAEPPERREDDRLAARGDREPELALEARQAPERPPARAREVDRVGLGRVPAEGAGQIRRRLRGQLRHLDRALDAEAPRRDDLEAGHAEIRGEFLGEARRVRGADRDALRARGLQRFDLAAHQRDHRR